jgi:hypothetical protein
MSDIAASPTGRPAQPRGRVVLHRCCQVQSGISAFSAFFAGPVEFGYFRKLRDRTRRIEEPEPRGRPVQMQAARLVGRNTTARLL